MTHPMEFLPSTIRQPNSRPPVVPRPGSLWPEMLSGPRVVWLAVAIPYLLLALSNAWDVSFLFSEMDSGQRIHGLISVAWPILALAGISLWAWMARLRGSFLSPIVAVVIWFTGSAALAIAVNTAPSMVPPSIPDWMFNSAFFIQRQLTFGIAPVLFGLSYLALMAAPVGVPRAVLLGVVAFGVSIGLSIAGSMIAGFLPIGNGGALFFLGFLIFMISAMVGGMIRVCMESYASVRATSALGISGVMALVCLALPLIGLGLNALVPFPFDFQTPGVWIFAAINGVALTLPAFRNPWLHRTVWLVQCVCFSFTLYFFAVFLPALIWAPIAVLCFGAGFLILVPTGVFLLHVWRLMDGWREAQGRSNRFLLGLAGVAAFVSVPAVLMVEAHKDKTDLDRAIGFFQSPEYSVNARLEGDPEAAARMLAKIQHLKERVRLPILDDYYQRVVLGGLVLPEKLIADLHRQLTGEDVPMARLGFSGAFGDRRFARRGMAVTEPPHPEMLQRVESQTVLLDPNTAQTTLRIRFDNPISGNAEFKMKAEVVQGAFVTGYRLKIGDEWVEGRLFDEKTATWLYDRIRLQVAPRDPGLLRISASGALSLSVFPVFGKEKRETEIVMIHPATVPIPATIVGAQIESPARPELKREALMTSTSDGNQVLIPREFLPESGRRKPLAVLIFGHTADRPLSPEILGSSRARFEAAGIPVQMFAANFETSAIKDGSLEIPARGAWDGPRSVVSALNSFVETTDLSQFYPVVILCGPNAPETKEFTETAAELRLRELAPENPKVHNLSSDDDPIPNLAASGASDVWVFRNGERIAAARAVGSMVCVRFPGDSASASIPFEVFDGGSSNWIPLAVSNSDSPDYVNAVKASFWARKRLMEPAHFAGSLGKWLSVAKEHGVLVPGLAFIAAETQAQWTTLERKEAERAKKDGSFEIQETSEAIPEPSTILLVVLGGLALGFRWWQMKKGQSDCTKRSTAARSSEGSAL